MRPEAGLGRVLLDSAVFIYAVGTAHDHQGPCRDILRALADDSVQAATSVLAVEEVLHQRARRTGDRASARRVAAGVSVLCPVLPLTADDVARGLQLHSEGPRLDARDAMHAATALNHGIDVIISPDRAFDDVMGLRRLDPVDAAALLRS